ncbi:MAG TPA: hypothetical protein VLG76_03070 [Rhabdochlamydiaceae bacterium]|nr:hypothetical protein [Rhabdochlamydiaceae bacterium]
MLPIQKEIKQTNFFLNTMLPFLNAEERCTASKVCKNWSAAARPFLEIDARRMNHEHKGIDLKKKTSGENDPTYWRKSWVITILNASDKEEISALLQIIPPICRRIIISNSPKLTSLPDAALFKRFEELTIIKCPNLRKKDIAGFEIPVYADRPRLRD